LITVTLKGKFVPSVIQKEDIRSQK